MNNPGFSGSHKNGIYSLSGTRDVATHTPSISLLMILREVRKKIHEEPDYLRITLFR